MPRPAALLACALALASARLLPAAAVDVTVLDAKGAGVPDAVVSLLRTDAPNAPAAPGRVEIAQQDQEFLPYVTVVPVGTEVEFPNRDDIQHHIYSLSRAKRFEKPLYAPGAHETVVFDQPGVVTLGCNIHDWMVAYVVVVPTPHHAKTDAAGAARVEVPPGRYRLEVWHPRLAAPESREVEAGPAGASLRFDVKLRPDRRIRRTPEGKAAGY